MKIEACMTPRLLALADCVTAGKRLADIGTDHAYLPVYLLQQGVIPSAIAMDINLGPIQRAESNIRKYHFEDKIETRLSNGLQQLQPGEAEEIVIAGMGGILIADILQADRRLWTEPLRFILQPMTAAEELRKFLEANGFCIERETLAAEENKIYQIFCAVRGSMNVEREVDYYISPYLLQHRHPLTGRFIERKIAEFEKMLSGLSRCERKEAREKKTYITALLQELYERKEECAKW